MNLVLNHTFARHHWLRIVGKGKGVPKYFSYHKTSATARQCWYSELTGIDGDNVVLTELGHFHLRIWNGYTNNNTHAL